MNIMQAWAGLSGNAKGWIEGLASTLIIGGVDVAIQELLAGGANLGALDWKQVTGAALIAGLVYVRGNLTGLLRYPDGSTIHAAPAPIPPTPTIVTPPAA